MNYNLEKLVRSINRRYLLISILTLVSFLCVRFIYKSRLDSYEKIALSLNVDSKVNQYFSSLSDQLVLIFTNDDFLDFLRSGYSSREDLKADVDILFSRLKGEEIVGFSIQIKGKEVHRSKNIPLNSKSFDVDLCYLGNNLNKKYGYCSSVFSLFIDRNKLYKKIADLSSDFKLCEVGEDLCAEYSFPTLLSSYFFDLRLTLLKLKFQSRSLKQRDDSLFFFSLLVILLLSVFIGYFLSTKRMINDIALPLKKIIESVRSGSFCFSNNNKTIAEFEYLMSELRTWNESKGKLFEIEKAREIKKIQEQIIHDVRAPLAALDTLTSMIPFNDLDIEFEVLMGRSVERIKNILDDLDKDLNSKIILREKNSLYAVIKEIISEKKLQYFKYPNLKITFLCESTNNSFNSFFDKKELKRVVSNLIDNSVEASDLCGVVQLRLTSNGEENLLEVEDKGTGIDNKSLEVVFDKGVSFKNEGKGLGLYHAKKTIESHGGRIIVKSILGEGSVVSIYLKSLN